MSAPRHFNILFHRLAIAIAGAAALTALTAMAEPRYLLTDLGTLPGTVSSTATSLNDRGEVAGYSIPAVENFNQTAFVWRNGVLASIGKLPKGNYSIATAINAAGLAAGDSDTGNYRPQSFIRDAKGSLVNFFSNNGGNTHAVAVSDKGVIGGYYTKSLSGIMSSWKAAIWMPDPKDSRKYTTVDLPVLAGPDPLAKSTCAFPAAFNQSGQAAGAAFNSEIGGHACFWNNNAAHTIVDLGTLPGDAGSAARGINDAGEVVGESYTSYGTRPVFWDNDPAHTSDELPLLPGDNYGTAGAINNIGQAIGWSGREPEEGNLEGGSPVLWQDGAVFDLQASLDAATGAGWVLNSASAINNLGQIAGAATRNGVTHAVLLTPLLQ